MVPIMLSLQLLHAVAAAAARYPATDPAPPALGSLAADWQPYFRGLSHPSDPRSPGWRGAPKHGLALPTANSELGSVIGDENVLAIRELTMPPFTQGPWSSVARDTSQLGRLSLDGQALYTQHSRWTPLGFERNATARDGRAVHTEVRLPLAERGVLLSLSVGAGPEADVALELVPQIRRYSSAEMNCSESQWRYPTNMQRNCWNWYAPRSFANETSDYTATSAEQGGLYGWTARDSVSGAVTHVALKFMGVQDEVDNYDNTSVTLRLNSAQPLRASIAVAFGAASEEAAVIKKAQSWAKDMEAAMAAVASERQARFDAVFDPEGTRYSGSLPLLDTSDAQLSRVYYAGVVSMLELERDSAAFPFAPPNTSRVFVTGAGSNASTNVFFWDMAYCVTALTLLDPAMVKSSLLHWMTPALASEALGGWGVDLYSGRAVGNHYAADDFTLFKRPSCPFPCLACVRLRPLAPWLRSLSVLPQPHG